VATFSFPGKILHNENAGLRHRQSAQRRVYVQRNELLFTVPYHVMLQMAGSLYQQPSQLTYRS